MTSTNRLSGLDTPTFAQMLTGIVSSGRELAAAHGAQLQLELRTQGAKAHSAFLQMGFGLELSGVGMAFLLVAVVMVLTEVLLWPAWIAWLAVGGLATIIGWIVWFVGRRRLSEVRLVPEQTLHSVQESLTCLANERI